MNNIQIAYRLDAQLVNGFWRGWVPELRVYVYADTREGLHDQVGEALDVMLHSFDDDIERLLLWLKGRGVKCQIAGDVITDYVTFEEPE